MKDSVSSDSPGHTLVVGDPRCGKTAGVLIPNILSLDNTPIVIVNDCRGEISEMVLRHRATRGPCLVLNPFGLRGRKSHGFNLLTDLDPLKPSFYSGALALGESAIQRRPTDSQPIFNLGAQTLYSVMAMLAKLTYGSAAHLGHVQTMVAMAKLAGETKGTDENLVATAVATLKTQGITEDAAAKVVKLFSGMLPKLPGPASAILDKAIRGDYSPDPDRNAPCPYPQFDIRNGGKPFEPLQLLARQFMEKSTTDNRFFQDRVATCQTETGRLNDPMLLADLAKMPKFNGEVFEFKRMRQWADPKRKRGVFTVVIMMPPKYFVTHAVYMRMLLSNVINSLMESEPDPETAPLTPLIIIEEMGQLGAVEAIKTSINMAAGNGIQYMMVFQQLAQMRETYGENGVGMILGACDTKLLFCSGDEYTQNHMSAQGGTKADIVRSWHDDQFGNWSNQNQQSVPLIRPEDIRDLKKGEAFAWIKHAPPVKVECPGYFNEKAWPNLRGKWDKNTVLPMNQRRAA